MLVYLKLECCFFFIFFGFFPVACFFFFYFWLSYDLLKNAAAGLLWFVQTDIKTD
jgi:hypothetical protein